MILLAIVDLCTGLKWFVLPLNGLQSGCLLVDVFSKTDILGGERNCSGTRSRKVAQPDD